MNAFPTKKRLGEAHWFVREYKKADGSELWLNFGPMRLESYMEIRWAVQFCADRPDTHKTYSQGKQDFLETESRIKAAGYETTLQRVYKAVLDPDSDDERLASTTILAK